MKRIFMTLVLLAVAMHTTALGQSCSNIYVFDPNDKKSHTVISRDPVTDAVLAKGKSAAVQTYELPIAWSARGKATTVKVFGLFDCSSNLESRDFVWVYFSFNGKKVKTIMVKGLPGATNMRVLDSLQIPYGTKVTMRAAMVCDQPDEYISLKKGYLELCQLGFGNGLPSDQIATEAPEDVEPLLQVANMDQKVKLSWKSALNIMPNFFKVERTEGNGKWEVVGFVKDQCDKSSSCEYHFIDSNPQITTIGYRIVRVDQKGKAFTLTEEARPVN